MYILPSFWRNIRNWINLKSTFSLPPNRVVDPPFYTNVNWSFIWVGLKFSFYSLNLYFYCNLVGLMSSEGCYSYQGYLRSNFSLYSLFYGFSFSLLNPAMFLFLCYSLSSLEKRRMFNWGFILKTDVDWLLIVW